MALPELVAVSPDSAPLHDARFDAVVLVTSEAPMALGPLASAVARQSALDQRVGREIMLIPAPEVAGGRLVLAPTGPLERDYDDVRRVGDAARRGMVRARDAGARRPLLVVQGAGRYPHAEQVALLGALSGLWVPLEAREAHGEERYRAVECIGLYAQRAPELVRRARALEQGRALARDLCGTEPERMRPEAFAADCIDAFVDSRVTVRVIEDLDTLGYQYPLLMGVARASLAVERHRPRVISLEYNARGPIEKTIFIAGKGLTYDTGGADLKVHGHMAGMSRDKGGAAAAVGLMRTLQELQPEGLRVVCELGVLRNSIGPDSYVSDEIITSHAGVRVRIGNTDAEGRLVLADLLSHLRKSALDAVDPHILSLATLTSHAHRAVGPYSIAIENLPARRRGVAQALSELGDAWGEPIELSRLRREDFDFIQPRSAAEDVISANTLPSAQTARGHQYPTAFLNVASGLARHGGDSDRPLPYTHLDLGGSATEDGDWQHGRPTAAPLVALTAWLAGLR
ncbi:MAG: peptidase [Myxococcaceae bacterium]|nr:peptidase [Myxococcaceae bacterium]